MLVIYCPERQQCVYTTAGAERSEEVGTLDVSMFIGKTVETWVGFFSVDGKEIATSIYTGSFPVT